MKPLAPVASHAEGACARALRMLDSYLDGELTVETTHDLLDHLGRCLACKGETEARQRLKAALRRVALMPEAAPGPSLAAGIRAEVARTRPHAGFGPLPVLLAAAVAVAAGVAVTRHRPAQEARTASAHALHLAEVTQVHCALGGSWPETPPEMAALKEHAHELAPVLPELADRLPGWGIVAAHRCLEEGQPVLHVILRRTGATGPSSLASLVIVPGKPGDSGPAPAPGARFRIVAQPGTGATDFVVTSGPDEEALDLARRALPLLKPVSA